MIEKFSKEELEIIKRELGIVGEVAVNKGFVCSKSKKELEDIWAKKYHEISKDKSEVDKYGREAFEKSIKDALKVLE